MNDEPKAEASNAQLVVITHAPHGTSWVKEGLDLVLVAASLGQEVSVLLSGEGIWAGIKEQCHGALGQKGTHLMLAALEMYDIDTVLVDAAAMTSRGLAAKDMLAACVPCDARDVLAAHTNIFVF